jgi:hypothetical protein
MQRLNYSPLVDLQDWFPSRVTSCDVICDILDMSQDKCQLVKRVTLCFLTGVKKCDMCQSV